MDAISDMYSVCVSLSEFRVAIHQLMNYARRYKTRLKGKNRVYVAQVIRLITSIVDYLQTVLERKQPVEGVLLASDIMAGKGVDQINPHKLSRYLHESKLARKVDGFVEHFQQTEKGQKHDPKTTVPALFHIQSFLLPLMNPSAEGRLFFARTRDDVELRYVLLDPTNHFREIVEDARAVILAGGTMSPVSGNSSALPISDSS
jgi:chromosome transmission fidelity protein 1